jgi:hypothetical protein
LSGADFFYSGNLNANLKADGLGRAFGSYGLYEGEFHNGLPNGYGRLILNHHNYYIGNFANGVYSNPGKFVKSDGTIIANELEPGPTFEVKLPIIHS